MTFNEKAHFLYQLKNKQLIEYSVFTLEYINKEEGNLIIKVIKKKILFLQI